MPLDSRYLASVLNTYSWTDVLDWESTLIADPAVDIANAIKLITIFYKYFLLGPEFESINLTNFSHQYLDAYRIMNPMDDIKIDYYGVVRSLNSLLEGVGGNQMLRHPPLVKDLLEFIHEITGIRIPESLELDITL